jgi:hypothetical protein
MRSLPSIVGCHTSILLDSAHEPNTDDGAEKPANGANKAEGLTGSPSIAHSAMCDSTPAKCATAAAILTQSVDEETEGGEPGGREDKVHWPVDEAACKGEKPNQAEEDRDAGDDFSVDEAFLRPCVGFVGGIEVGADDACDNTCADELGEAKRHGYEARHDRHAEDRLLSVSVLAFDRGSILG